MQGYQFAHMELYSVKGAPGANPNRTAKRKNGQRAWTAAEVFDEAERRALAALHVTAGAAPPQILPGDVDSFEALREAHARAASRKESFGYTKKDGSRQTRRRKMRADAATLYTCVVSLPVRTEDALLDGVVRVECLDVLSAAMDHERKRIEACGGKLMMGVVHWDEEHVHAHYYGLTPEHGRVDRLHPGRVAKAEFRDEHDGCGEDPKDVTRGSNRAYCDAMRQWQDDFHAAIFDDAGLLRFGPRRLRLSRAEYKKLKTAKGHQKSVETRIAGLSQQEAALSMALADYVEQGLGNVEAVRQATEQILQDKQRLLAEKAEVEKRRRDAESRAALADQEIGRAQGVAASAEALRTALEVGCTALDNREIAYREATEEKVEGLKFGPGAPKEKAARDRLAQTIQPAYDFVLGLARRLFRLEKREAESEARQETAAAELRRRAEIVVAGERAAARAVPAALADIAAGRPTPLDEDAFPGAWAIDRTARPYDVSRRLDATPNLELRSAWQATRDAVMICEDDAALQARFAMGLKVLEVGAEQRGFDLETGRQDPAAAKDPAKATLHRDQLSEGLRITRKVRQRERVR